MDNCESCTRIEKEKKKLERRLTKLQEEIAFLEESRSKSLNLLEQIESQRQQITDLAKTLERQSESLAELNRDLGAVFHAIEQGVLTINPDLRIDTQYSKHVEVLFSTNDIAGRIYSDLLFHRTNLQHNDRSQIETALVCAMKEPSLTFSLNEHLLPREMEHHSESGIKYLALDWKPIVDDHDIVLKILLTIRDTTHYRKLQAEAESKRIELSILEQVLAMGLDKFDDFLQFATRTLQRNKELVLAKQPDEAFLLAELFRNMHTLKGVARQYGLSLIVNHIHEAEHHYDQTRKRDLPFDRSLLISDLSSIQHKLRDYERFVDEKLKALVNRSDSNDRPQSSDLEAILKDSINSLESLSAELGKIPPNVNIEPSGIRFLHPYTQLLEHVFVHCFRNSLDHGIECPRERKKTGKPERGSIYLSCALESDGTVVIHYRDDGRGLNLAALRAKAEEQCLSAIPPTDDQLAEMIFELGTSTALTLSSVSGRGVGMNAVRESLSQNGASISVLFVEPANSSEFRQFQFEIRLPRYATLPG